MLNKVKHLTGCKAVRTKNDNTIRETLRYAQGDRQTENCTLLRLVEQAKLLYQAVAKSRHYEVLPQRYGALCAIFIIWRQQGQQREQRQQGAFLILSFVVVSFVSFLN